MQTDMHMEAVCSSLQSGMHSAVHSRAQLLTYVVVGMLADSQLTTWC